MHKLGTLIQELMDREGMTRPEFVRRSGLTRQHVHTLLVADELKRMPQVETIKQLCRAFPHVAPQSFVLAAAEAAGLEVAAVEPDYSQLTNQTLLGILAERLEGGSDAGTTREKSPGGGNPEPVTGEDEGSVVDFPDLTGVRYAARRDLHGAKETRSGDES